MNILTESLTCRMEKIRLVEGGRTIGMVLLIVWPHFQIISRTRRDRTGNVLEAWQEFGTSGLYYATVQDNGVIARLQGMGHGQALLDRLIARARELGVTRITLTASDERAAARHIYVKRGFEPTTQGYVMRLPKKETT